MTSRPAVATGRGANQSQGITLHRFINLQKCHEAVQSMRDAPLEPSPVYISKSNEAQQLREARASRRIYAPLAIEDLMLGEIGRARTEILRCLGSLANVPEPVQFLEYQVGDHFIPHADTAADAPSARVASRRISIVIFLSTQGTDYGGGELLLQLPTPGHRTLVLPPVVGGGSAGDLVAFRSNVLHEVRPVTWGRRVTAVTFLHANGGF